MYACAFLFGMSYHVNDTPLESDPRNSLYSVHEWIMIKVNTGQDYYSSVSEFTFYLLLNGTIP